MPQTFRDFVVLTAAYFAFVSSCFAVNEIELAPSASSSESQESSMQGARNAINLHSLAARSQTPESDAASPSEFAVIATFTPEDTLELLGRINQVSLLPEEDQSTLRQKVLDHFDRNYNVYLTLVMTGTTGYVAYALERSAVVAQGRVDDYVFPWIMGGAIGVFEGAIQAFIHPYTKWVTDKSFFIPTGEKGEPWKIYTKRLAVCMIFAGIVTTLGTLGGTDQSVDLGSATGAISSFLYGNTVKAAIYIGSTHYFFEFLAQQRHFVSKRVQGLSEAIINLSLTQIANAALFLSRENQESGIWASVLPPWIKETFGFEMNTVSAALSSLTFATGFGMWTWSLPKEHGFRKFLQRRKEGCMAFFGVRPQPFDD